MLCRYTEEQMRAINNEHREARTWSDKVALAMVQGLRWGMDFVTGYRHPPKGLDKDNNNKVASNFKMSEREWLNRILFLESVAGVPGMVAGMLRHLRSLRTMRRDNGWYVFPPCPFRWFFIGMFTHKITTGLRLFSKKPTTNACTCLLS